MKQTWEITEACIQDFKEQLEELLEMLPQSAKFYKKTGDINKAWKKVQKSLNDMDQFISPVKSVDVKSPLFSDAAFKESWQLWKDYLNEQHGLFMRSRAELMALKRISDISDANAAAAIRYLEFAMSRMDKNFYKVNETEEPKKPDAASNGKTIIKLPLQYLSIKNEKLEIKNEKEEKKPPIFHQKTIGEEIAEFKKSKRNSIKN
jgi:hypothetical protein